MLQAEGPGVWFNYAALGLSNRPKLADRRLSAANLAASKTHFLFDRLHPNSQQSSMNIRVEGEEGFTLLFQNNEGHAYIISQSISLLNGLKKLMKMETSNYFTPDN